MAKTIQINATDENTDVQQMGFTKQPGQALTVTVVFGTDQEPPNHRRSVNFAASEVPGAGTNKTLAQHLKACRDYALVKDGF